MAFASVTSLKNTIERLLNSSHISIVDPSPEIIEFPYKQLKSLQEILKRLDSASRSSNRKRVNALDGQIREAACKLEDVLESHFSNQIVSQSESLGGERHRLLFSIDLQDLKQDIHSFTERVKKMEDEYINELCNPLPEEEEDEALSLRIDFGGKKSKIVGLSDQLSEVRDWLIDGWFTELPVFSLVGMPGIGKTTFAKEIFEDPLIFSRFDCRAWVTVGPKCQLKKIQRVILAQVDPDTEKMLTEGDEEIGEYLEESLKGRSYLIVFDDVWDKWVLDYLESSLPYDDMLRSGVLLTTRLQKLAPLGLIVEMRLLNKEESWDLLREKVFGEELCPHELEKAGKKIAENCEGLPLMIVRVADILSKKAKKTPEYWNKVAEKQNSVFVDAYNEISKVLYPSYEYLHQHLKACFLYMGVFPQNYEIPRSKLINMWIAEGFLEPNIFQDSKYCASKSLEELASNSLVMACQDTRIFPHRIKTCRLHSSLWHLCNREAWKNKFFHVLNSHADVLEGGIKSQRGLCIHNNILFGIKNVYNSIEDDCASTARSLLCFGPYHQYPVPICFGLRLLRVLDALTIRFYEFPIEVLKLGQLRYLALTYNGKLPASISKLWNLQFLIIFRHMSIKSCGAPSYVPIEIWDMQELRHLQIMGSNLLNPNCGASLQNLLTLLDVSPHSCTKGVLRRIRNLKKLGIQIELAPVDDGKSFRCLNRISRLRKLESLKCVIVNPELGPEFVPPPAPLSMFPSGLKKLHLSGLGYPWEYMSIIGSLSSLEVLKLRSYAFRGPKWEIKHKEFVALKFLLIEETDLVQWKVENRGFHPWLRCLSIKHCYKLEELQLGHLGLFLHKIEIVDCNPLAATYVKQLKEARPAHGFDRQDYDHAHSSWDDENHKP